VRRVSLVGGRCSKTLWLEGQRAFIVGFLQPRSTTSVR